MGLIVLEGLLITVLVLTGFRRAVFEASAQLKTAIAVGIGFFLTIIGLVDAGFIRRAQEGVVPISFGINGQLAGWPLLVFVVGLLLMSVLVVRRVKGALLIGIVATTVLAIIVEAIADIGPTFTADGINPRGWALQVPTLPDEVVSTPDLSLIGNFSLFGGFERIGVLAALLIVFSLMIADFFDTVGTVTAVGAEGNLLDENRNLPKSQPVLLVDSLAAPPVARAASPRTRPTSRAPRVWPTAPGRPGQRRHRRAVPDRDVLHAAGAGRPVGGRRARAGHRRRADDHPDPAPGLGRHVAGHPRVPHDRADAVHLLDHQRHRRRRHHLRPAVGGDRPARRIHPLMWVIAALFVVYFALEPLQQLL